MPYKDKEKQRAAQRAYANKHQPKQYAYQHLRKVELRQWFEGLKDDLSCKCGESHNACLEFHHRDGSDKHNCVSWMVCKGYSKEKILAEIAKCDVICANCHRKLHYNESSGSYAKQQHIKKNKTRKRSERKFDPSRKKPTTPGGV